MATCQNGHTSAADDWCEVCGIRMTSGAAAPMPGAPVPPPPPPGPGMGSYGYPGGMPEPTQPAELCPQCRTPREAMAPFCEECRYNFLTHSPTTYVPTGSSMGMGGGSTGTTYPPRQDGYTSSRPSQMNRPAEPLHTFPAQQDPRAGASGDFLLTPPPGSDPYAQGADPYAQGSDPYAPGPVGHDPYGPAPTGWVAVVAPDREYFTSMMSRSGPEASGLNLPAYSPEQKIPLQGPQMSIGRRRQSTGESPHIDLSRPPEDPGVSHNHAVLVEQPDGSWAVVDQNSTNGTTINGGADPIQPFVPVPLREGDRVHVGAWTTIRLQRG
ncbi:FHA domain-containing protein [Streptomyces sp. NPDC051940]|uniref:FHA domain-containing protein n=1 Tax=Streptomyces sp. NPDC051940 TaxID=3155675 RepID=UPI003413E49C